MQMTLLGRTSLQDHATILKMEGPILFLMSVSMYIFLFKFHLSFDMILQFFLAKHKDIFSF